MLLLWFKLARYFGVMSFGLSFCHLMRTGDFLPRRTLSSVAGPISSKSSWAVIGLTPLLPGSTLFIG